jgi:hypothetical protein
MYVNRMIYTTKKNHTITKHIKTLKHITVASPTIFFCGTQFFFFYPQLFFSIKAFNAKLLISFPKYFKVRQIKKKTKV